jgi:hypothetical protein
MRISHIGIVASLLLVSLSGLIIYETRDASAGAFAVDYNSSVSCTGGNSYIYVAGTSASYSFANSEAKPNSHKDIAIFKYDTSNGDILWFRTWETTQYVYDYAVATSIYATLDYVYVAGYIKGIGQRTDTDIVLLKYNIDGTPVTGEYFPVLEHARMGDDYINSLVLRSGYLYTAGYTSTGTPGDYDIFCRRYESNGYYSEAMPYYDWTTTKDIGLYNNNPNSDDKIFSMIATEDYLFLAGSTNAWEVPLSQNRDLLLMKLNRATGTIIRNDGGDPTRWPIHWDNAHASTDVAVYSITFDKYAVNPTDFYVVGEYLGIFCQHVAVYQKYNFQGSLSWGMGYSGPGAGNFDTHGRSIAVDASFLYMTGDYYLPWQGQGQGPGHYRAFVWKGNPANGQMGPNGWDLSWGGASDGYGYAIGVDRYNPANIFIVGSSNSYSASVWDMGVVKYAPDGSLTWYKIFGESYSDYGNAIAHDDDYSLYVVGSTNSYSDGKDRIYTSGPDSNAFIAKYDTSGQLLWYSVWDGYGYDDCAYAIAYYSSYVYIAGYTTKSIAGGGTSQMIFVLRADSSNGHIMGNVKYYDSLSATDACAYALAVYDTRLYVTGFQQVWDGISSVYTKDVIVLSYDLTQPNWPLVNGWPVYWTRIGDNYDDCAYAIAIAYYYGPIAIIVGETNYPFAGSGGGYDGFFEELDLTTKTWIFDDQSGQHPGLIGGTGDDRTTGLTLRYNDDGSLNCIYATGYIYIPADTHYHPFVAKYLLNSNWDMWRVTTGSAGDNDERGFSITSIPQTSPYQIIVAGTRDSSQGVVIRYSENNQNVGSRGFDIPWGGGAVTTGCKSVTLIGTDYYTAGYAYTTQLNYGGSYDAQILKFAWNNQQGPTWVKLWG